MTNAGRIGVALLMLMAVACRGASSPGVTPGASPGRSQSFASPSSSTPAESDAIPGESLPIDPNMEAVSRSSPRPAASQALEACGFDDFQQRPLSMVAGMGKAASGYAARDYAPLTGREPELMTQGPVWMIQLSGELTDPFTGEVSMDALCVSIDGQAGYYSIGDIVLSDGSIHTPRPVPDPPEYSLPSLAP